MILIPSLMQYLLMMKFEILVASDFVHPPHQIAHLPTSSFSAAKMCPATDAKVVCTWAVSLVFVGKSPANLSFYQVNSGGCDPLKWLCAFSKLRRLCNQLKWCVNRLKHAKNHKLHVERC